VWMCEIEVVQLIIEVSGWLLVDLIVEICSH
jgi:hypothetical protein